MTKSKIYNIKDHHKSLEIIKWLRQQGVRGSDWDFSGGGRNVSIWFKNDKVELAYILMYDWAD